MPLRFVNGELTFADDEQEPLFTPGVPNLGTLAPTVQQFRNPAPSMGGFINPLRDQLNSEIQSKQDLLNTQILKGYQRPQLDMQTALVDSLVALAPSLIASAVLDRKKYGGIIGEQGANALTAVQANRNKMLEGEQLAAQQQAAVTANQLQNLQMQDRQLDLADVQGQYNIARAEAYGAARGDNEPIDEVQAQTLSEQYGIPIEQAQGLTAKQARELRLTYAQKNQLNNQKDKLSLERDKFNRENAEREVIGTVIADPQQTSALLPGESTKLQEKIGDAASLDAMLEEYQTIAANSGNNFTGIDAAKLNALTSSILNVHRKLTNSGAALNPAEFQMLKAVSPIATASDPVEALKRQLLDRDGLQFISYLRNLNNTQLAENLGSANRVLPGGLQTYRAKNKQLVEAVNTAQAIKNTPATGSIMSDAQRARLAELRAKRGQ